MDAHTWTPPRKVSGTKRTAQSTFGRGYPPAPGSSGRGFRASSSSGPLMSSGSRPYVPAADQPSGFSAPMRGQMRPSGSRYIRASIHRQPHRTSYPFTQPLAPPQGLRSRYSLKRPVRQADSSPISTRKIMTSTISAPVPVKAAQHNLPYWQVTDSASARATESRRFAAMTVGHRSTTQNSEYRDITRTKFSYSNQNVRKEYDSNAVLRPLGRKAARKSEEQQVPQDESSSSESSESDGDSDDWETVPSDQDSELDKPEESDSSDDDSVEIIEREPYKPPVIELLDDTPPMSPTPLSKPPEDIVTAIEGLTLSLACMDKLRRLPFLKRNVRRGFLNYCHARGVSTRQTEDYVPSITVAFRLAASDLDPHKASISCHECPLCQLHLPFQTREMLEIHLDLDHDEVKTIWDKIDEQIWGLVLVLPSQSEDVRMSPSPGIQSFHPEAATPEPAPSTFGPTARYPFLPAKSEYGGSDVNYSARFGGPKIYDLLNTLPMEPFGLLAWSVLDKEEEIFESDDIPDEHKVIHALWARWIFFNHNRNFFIANYCEGVKTFIDEYWRMIRLAAGWSALRYWLLMLMANRYLLPKEVALLLARYERWCSDE